MAFRILYKYEIYSMQIFLLYNNIEIINNWIYHKWFRFLVLKIFLWISLCLLHAQMINLTLLLYLVIMWYSSDYGMKLGIVGKFYKFYTVYSNSSWSYDQKKKLNLYHYILGLLKIGPISFHGFWRSPESSRIYKNTRAEQ